MKKITKPLKTPAPATKPAAPAPARKSTVEPKIKAPAAPKAAAPAIVTKPKGARVTITAIVDAVRMTLERCPPELSADLVDRGFVMAGGGSLIRGIDRLLSDKTGLPVIVADDPLSAVANGTGAVLNDLSWLMQNV